MNHNIEFQCPDLSSSWSPGTQRLLTLLQWNILRLLNNINTLQCSAQVRVFGHLEKAAGFLPVHLAIRLPVTITGAWYSKAPSILASILYSECRSDMFSRHIIYVCKMNIVFVAQRHETFIFPPVAILEIQTDGGKKQQGRAQDALAERHAIWPVITASSRQAGFQLTPCVWWTWIALLLAVLQKAKQTATLVPLKYHNFSTHSRRFATSNEPWAKIGSWLQSY